MNQFDWLGKWAGFTPDRNAIEEFETGRRFTYAEMNDIAEKVAFYLTTVYNLKTGDRIAVLSENRAELIALFSAAQKTGITLVPLNFRLTSDELDYIIGNCEPSLFLFEDQFLEKLEKTKVFSTIKNKFDIDELIPAALTVENGSLTVPEFDENHPVFILYTSGTTAFPKGAIYSHKMLFWNSINTEMRLEITSSDVSIDVAPPFHTGFWNVLLTPFLHHGAETILMRKFDAEAIMKLIEEREISLWWAVPTMLKMMSDSPEFVDRKLSTIRYMVVGGEAMPIPLIEVWHNKGVPIRQGYGLTEVGPNITSLSEVDAIRKQGSIGTPNFYVETCIVDENGDQIVGEGEGEFLLKGSNVTPGYWKNEEATMDTIVGGWFHTGDVVRRDSEGYYYVVDRIKNMYISGGENVYPAQVEYLLRKHDSIDDVVIIGVPDPKWGESGKAFVVKKEGTSLTEQEVIDYCTGKLAKYKIPRHVEFIPELPKNDAGKIDRKSLKKKENE
ncbi:MAG: acid--CoA ligase [Melioribacteraceae bacterium]|nr:MAG: acid--CoA ligase [Melioribacteraceae bacterium]